MANPKSARTSRIDEIIKAIHCQQSNSTTGAQEPPLTLQQLVHLSSEELLAELKEKGSELHPELKALYLENKQNFRNSLYSLRNEQLSAVLNSTNSASRTSTPSRSVASRGGSLTSSPEQQQLTVHHGAGLFHQAPPFHDGGHVGYHGHGGPYPYASYGHLQMYQTTPFGHGRGDGIANALSSMTIASPPRRSRPELAAPRDLPFSQVQTKDCIASFVPNGAEAMKLTWQGGYLEGKVEFAAPDQKLNLRNEQSQLAANSRVAVSQLENLCTRLEQQADIQIADKEDDLKDVQAKAAAAKKVWEDWEHAAKQTEAEVRGLMFKKQSTVIAVKLGLPAVIRGVERIEAELQKPSELKAATQPTAPSLEQNMFSIGQPFRQQQRAGQTAFGMPQPTQQAQKHQWPNNQQQMQPDKENAGHNLHTN